MIAGSNAVYAFSTLSVLCVIGFFYARWDKMRTMKRIVRDINKVTTEVEQ